MNSLSADGHAGRRSGKYWESGGIFRVTKINMEPIISEGFGNIPNASENFGKVPQDSEEFRTMRNHAERTEQHTLTVRETARLFEESGVPRTERSIINWCQRNRQGIARLDAFFDTNERKYFITPQSTTLAIREEQAKAATNGQQTNGPEKEERTIPKAAERNDDTVHEYKLRDLEISNRAKDYFIEQLQKERDVFNSERQNYIGQLMSYSRQIGELETQLLQIDAPVSESKKSLPLSSEFSGKDDAQIE